MKECEFFHVSLSIRGFCELKPRIHASSSRDSCVCIYDKKISVTDQDQEHKFRGSISLTINDCIIGTVSVYFLVLNDDDMVSYDEILDEPCLLFAEEYSLFSHMDKMEVL